MDAWYDTTPDGNEYTYYNCKGNKIGTTIPFCLPNYFPSHPEMGSLTPEFLANSLDKVVSPCKAFVMLALGGSVVWDEGTTLGFNHNTNSTFFG